MTIKIKLPDFMQEKIEENRKKIILQEEMERNSKKIISHEEMEDKILTIIKEYPIPIEQTSFQQEEMLERILSIEIENGYDMTFGYMDYSDMLN